MPASCGVQGPGSDLVVAADNHLRAKLAHVLHEVVGEGVVVVEDKHHEAILRLRQQGGQRWVSKGSRYDNDSFKAMAALYGDGADWRWSDGAHSSEEGRACVAAGTEGVEGSDGEAA
jgi:hypothetical protein